MATVEELMRESELKKKELTAFKRQVGRMPYKQARSLFEETSRKLDEHRENHCDQCVWRTEGETDRCDVHEAMGKDWLKGRGEYAGMSHNERMTAISKIHKLEHDCPNCTYRSWDVVEECPYSDEVYELYHIYAHRVQHLQARERDRQFKQAHGRPHKDVLELMDWIDKQPPLVMPE